MNWLVEVAAFYGWALKEAASRTLARNRWTVWKLIRQLAFLAAIIGLAYALNYGPEVQAKFDFGAIVALAFLTVALLEILGNFVYVIYEAARGGSLGTADIKLLHSHGIELLLRIKAGDDWEPEHVQEWEESVVAALHKAAPQEVFGFETFGNATAIANSKWDSAASRLTSRLEKLRLIIMRLDNPKKN